MEKKVAILLSTYNGEKYIEELINSIFSQTYNNITIVIRDDGSSDSTVQIIKSIKEKNDTNKKIIILEDNEGNIGFANSFKILIKESKGFDYYALCDQDDFWLPEKIESAVNCLNNCDESKPSLYVGEYWICDGMLNKIEKHHVNKSIDEKTLANIFMEGWMPGFTMVMNDTLKEKAFGNLDNSIPSHDKWICSILKCRDCKTFYDENPSALYRRHENAASSSDLKILKKLRWRIKNILKGDYLEKTLEMIRIYKNLFREELESDEDKRFIDIFSNGRLKNKIFYNKRLRNGIIDEVAVRVLILVNKQNISQHG